MTDEAEKQESAEEQTTHQAIANFLIGVTNNATIGGNQAENLVVAKRWLQDINQGVLTVSPAENPQLRTVD